VLSNTVMNELLPVSTTPPLSFPVSVLGLRSEGKAIVIELVGPASARSFRRRMKANAPNPSNPASAIAPTRTGQLSRRSSTMDGGGGAGFFAAAAGLGGAAFGASATFGASAGFAASAFGGSAFGASAFGASAGFGASTGFTSATFGA